MNERIKELAFEAITERLSIDEYIEALKKEPHDFYGFRVNELEKFAELLIQRCTELSDLAEKNCLHPATIIKRHFGVE